MKKLAFITGGSRGIGREMVKKFHAAGYITAFSYCSQTKLADELLNMLGKDCLAVQLNQGNPESIMRALEVIGREAKTHIDVLVNNGAIAQEKPFDEITPDDWSTMMNVNLQGPFLLAQHVSKEMQAKRWGRIINISSIGGQWGGFNQVHYAASKAGLISLTQSLAKIYSKDQITANAIAIGLVATDMTQRELESDAGQKKVSSIPAGRLGRAEEIADIALFLASEEASYITGQTINVNGGMYFG